MTSARLARVIYTGGYVLPGSTPSAGQPLSPTTWNKPPSEQGALLVAEWTSSKKKEETFLCEILGNSQKHALFINGPFQPGYEET